MYENELKEESVWKKYYSSCRRFAKSLLKKLGILLIIAAVVGGVYYLVQWQNESSLAKLNAIKNDPAIAYYEEKTDIALSYETNSGTIVVYFRAGANTGRSIDELKRVGLEFIINNSLSLRENTKPQNPTVLQNGVIYYTVTK